VIARIENAEYRQFYEVARLSGAIDRKMMTGHNCEPVNGFC